MNRRNGLSRFWNLREEITQMIHQAHSIQAIYDVHRDALAMSYRQFLSYTKVYMEAERSSAEHVIRKGKYLERIGSPPLPDAPLQNQASSLKKNEPAPISSATSPVNGLGHQSGELSSAQPPTEITESTKEAVRLEIDTNPSSPAENTDTDKTRNNPLSKLALPPARGEKQKYESFYSDDGHRLAAGSGEWVEKYKAFLLDRIREGLDDDAIWEAQVGYTSMSAESLKGRYLEVLRRLERDKDKPKEESIWNPPWEAEELKQLSREERALKGFIWDGKCAPLEYFFPPSE